MIEAHHFKGKTCSIFMTTSLLERLFYNKPNF